MIAVIASGCGGSVTLTAPSFPEPLIDKMNVTVGLRMAPEMYAFSHEEEVLGRETWSVDLGDANAKMFEELFGHMFTGVAVLSADDDPGVMPIDALVETGIDAFEFSVPEQTGTNSFAVWIRYRMKVYNTRGDMVANWPVSAYGKSESRAMAASDSLEKAALLAMRDAAALVIMKLDNETGIGALGGTGVPAAEDDPAPPTTPAHGQNIASIALGETADNADRTTP